MKEMEQYKSRTTAFGHQEDIFQKSRDMPRYALFWEMGCGKTKPTIDTFGHLLLQGKVDCLIVIAPRGVHRQWITDEFPVHFPQELYRRCDFHFFQVEKSSTKWHEKQCRYLQQTPKPVVIAVTYDGIMTKKCEKLVRYLLEHRKCMIVADEASYIKNPNAKRSIRAITLAKYAQVRRILTGTPIANGPFDLFMMFKFLSVEYWKPYGVNSYTVFKNFFGVWQDDTTADGKPYRYLVAYQRLEKLGEYIQPMSDRKLKEDVLDLPPKLYKRYTFDLNEEQKRLYDELENDFMAWIEGNLVTAPLVITRLLRFQQITSGYIPHDSGDPVFPLGSNNPRLELLADILDTIPHKCIIWSKFTRDIEKIQELVGRDKCVTYTGSTSDSERAEALARFRGYRPREDGTREPVPLKDQVQWFIGNQAAGGMGLNMVQAKTVVYYNTTFKLPERKQSEDRAHRIGQDDPVQYIDLVAEDTVDIRILNALLRKQDISDTILRDRKRAWLTNE